MWLLYLHNAATREVDLRKQVKTIILLNCTDADDLTLRITPHGKQFQVQSYRPDWTKQGDATAMDVGDSPVQYRVLQGAATIQSR